jgi:CBS domain-containing protein
MSVKYLLDQKGSTVYSIEPDAAVYACVDLLNSKRIGALLVLDADGALLGIVSERDVLHVTGEKKGSLEGVTVRAIMTPRKRLVTADLQSDVRELMETMTARRVRHIPILDDDRVAGIVSIGDVVKMLLDEVLTENKQMQDYITGQYA